MMCGGLGPVSNEAHPELIAAILPPHEKILADAGITAEKLNLIHYSSQVVSGTNYFCKLQIDGTDDCVHARIFQGLPHTGGAFEVHGVQGGHKMGSEVAYF